MSRSMKDVVEEFNKLTGKSVKRFATVGAGEKAIERFKNAKDDIKPNAKAKAAGKAKALVPATKTPATATKKQVVVAGNYKMRITVDGEEYRSVAVAFHDIGLPIKSHIKFRGALKKEKSKVFEHNGKKYLFKLNG